jgi:anti-anti-sigma factor
MTATATRSFDVEFVRNVTVVRFTIDSLDESNIEAVADELHTLMYEQRPRRVVVDMVALRRIDDLGLAVVQSFHDAVEEVGGTAILCRLTLSVMGAVSDSGLNRMLHIRPSLSEALWTF